MSRRRRGSSAAGADAGDAAGGVSARARAALTLARVIDLVTAVVCVLIVVGILLVVLGANLDNAIAGRLHTWADTLTNPFHGLFTPKGRKARIAVNWGLALAVYFVIGRVLASAVRRFGGASA